MMPDAFLEAVRGLRVANPDLGIKPLLAKLREQQPNVEAGTREVREALMALKAGAEANVDAFVYAAGEGDIDAIENFIAMGMPPDLARTDGETALWAAVEAGGHTNIVSALLRAGARSEPLRAGPATQAGSNKIGATPLDMACQCGYLEIVRSLISHGASVHGHPKSQSPLRQAVKYGRLAITALLLENNACVNAPSSGATVLFVALHRGCQSKFDDGTMMVPSCYRQPGAMLKMTKLLLAASADPNLLPLQGVDGEEGQSTPLHMTAGTDAVDVAAALLDAGAKINNDTSDCPGSTALNLACEAGAVGVARLLVARGADVNIAIKYSTETPLYTAVRSMHAPRCTCTSL